MEISSYLAICGDARQLIILTEPRAKNPCPGGRGHDFGKTSADLVLRGWWRTQDESGYVRLASFNHRSACIGHWL